jgi:hypothetical protein
MSRLPTLPIRALLFALLCNFVSADLHAAPSLGLRKTIVTEVGSTHDVPLFSRTSSSPILVDANDSPSVLRAVGDLQQDVHRVGGPIPVLKNQLGPSVRDAENLVIVGTIGRSRFIDALVAAGKLDVSHVRGQWESFVVATVEDPMPHVKRALVIAGSDRRGTIYGIYEISEQMGVSPWYWWADVPPQHHTKLFVKQGIYLQGPPAVMYRGIFINDEEPSFGGWARAKFGGINSKMYAHMFELLLRLRANYLWPAMWGKAFNEDDPLNPKVADLYGIVMGTSHHEPMMRAQAEWTRHRAEFGNGDWDYTKNSEGLRKFWTQGVIRNKAYENIYTVGMRGDLAMPDAGGLQANKKLLEQIIADQRSILAHNVNPDVTKVPQVWALFTEVQKYYDAGLKVPDDVTLLFTDDNVGNLRRVPTPQERNRSGGAGIYYHLDMNGGPFSYKWLNSNPLPKIWEQMNLAVQYGATRIWIVNVGDLKPLEIPLEFMMRYAYNPSAITQDSISTYQTLWAEREFGPQHAAEIADLVAKYVKYNASPKPELVKPDTFSLTYYREAERVWDNWDTLATRANQIHDQLPAKKRDAYYELVLYPIVASGNAVKLEIAAGLNQRFARQGRASTNTEADAVQSMFQRDAQLSSYFNNALAGGKWNHMMDQIHIGYFMWSTPLASIMPPVSRIEIPPVDGFGISPEASERDGVQGRGWHLPDFDSLNPRRSFVDVYPTGAHDVPVLVQADQHWVKIEQGHAFSADPRDRRYWVSIDWTKAPAGESQAHIQLSGAGQNSSVTVTCHKATPEQMQQAVGRFASLTGPLSIDAADATRNIAAGNVHWVEIPDYGKFRSGMTVFPVTAATVFPDANAARLEYDLYLPQAGKYDIDLLTNPTLDLYPGRELAVAVALDNQPPQTVAVFTPQTQADETFLGKNFYRNTHDNQRVMHFTGEATSAGQHTLSIRMVDPTVVVERIVIHKDPLPKTFFGPPAIHPYAIQ